jgi:hypothetical protein
MRRSRRRKWIGGLSLGLALVLVAAAIVGLMAVRRARMHLASAQAGLAQLEAALGGEPADLVGLLQDPERVAALRSTLTALDADLAALQGLVRPVAPLAPALGWLPGIGGDVAAAPHLLDMGRQTAAAAGQLADLVLPIAERLSQSQASLEGGVPQIIAGLAEGRAYLDAARSALSLAQDARAAIDTRRLSARTLRLLERFDRYAPLLDSSLQALGAMPAALGGQGPRTYLLLAQNNQELRATGGFISGVGVARVEDGRIVDLRFADSYAVDDLSQPHALPPAPLRRYMKAGLLLLRDANWWPDFPTSAKAIADLYRQDQGTSVDGVIALDLTTLRLLVQALGPIEVPGYDQPVTADNLQPMLMEMWEAPRLTAPGKESADWWTHRKDFAGDLLSALLDQALGRNAPDDWGAVAQALGTALQQRHLLAYVQDPEVEKLLQTMGWDGALQPAAGDYLMVVDSNVGFNKVNPNIEQTVDYRVTVDEGGSVSSELILGYRHRIQRPTPACIHDLSYGDSYVDLMDRCYWDYVRIHIPAGSQSPELQGADEAEVYDEGGKTVLGAFLLLETGQARQVKATYRPALPPLESHYSLLVQKQPGSAVLPLRVSVTLPPGARPVTASPSDWLWADGRVTWQTTLDRDFQVDLTWE